jgi:hypothetical protein
MYITIVMGKVVLNKQATPQSKLNIETLQNVVSKNGKIKKRVMKFERKDGKDITYAFTQDIYDTFLKQGIKAENIYVQVMANRELTLKSLGETEFKDWDNEEYYMNRIDDTSEFLNNFQYVRICIME